MQDQLQAFLDWYLAPWRRIGRKEFAIALTLATLPGLVFMMIGFTDSAGHFLGPLMNLGNIGENMNTALNGGDMSALQNQMNSTNGMLGGLFGGGNTAKPFSIDWSGVFNNALLLGLLPLTRMRLRDMGWFGKQELGLTLAFNVSVLGSLIESLTSYNPIPMATLFGLLNFAGYIWLSSAKGKARQAVSERTDYTIPTPDANRTNQNDDYDRY